MECIRWAEMGLSFFKAGWNVLVWMGYQKSSQCIPHLQVLRWLLMQLVMLLFSSVLPLPGQVLECCLQGHWARSRHQNMAALLHFVDHHRLLVSGCPIEQGHIWLYILETTIVIECCASYWLHRFVPWFRSLQTLNCDTWQIGMLAPSRLTAGRQGFDTNVLLLPKK